MGFKQRTNKLAVTFALVGFISVISRIKSLENGLARTPPMGWLSWVCLSTKILNSTINHFKFSVGTIQVQHRLRK